MAVSGFPELYDMSLFISRDVQKSPITFVSDPTCSQPLHENEDKFIIIKDSSGLCSCDFECYFNFVMKDIIDIL